MKRTKEYNERERIELERTRPEVNLVQPYDVWGLTVTQSREGDYEIRNRHLPNNDALEIIANADYVGHFDDLTCGRGEHLYLSGYITEVHLVGLRVLERLTGVAREVEERITWETYLTLGRPQIVVKTLSFKAYADEEDFDNAELPRVNHIIRLGDWNSCLTNKPPTRYFDWAKAYKQKSKMEDKQDEQTRKKPRR
ncbi:hypothetical protein J4447_00600 [Candidatus Pacearchaeota archaeon]|nr:hypothetical protein [Candidatus Pacearchaeota archaeon]